MSYENNSKGKDVVQRGYSVESEKKSLRPGWCKEHQIPPKNTGDGPPKYLKDVREEQLTLFGPNDEYVAIATNKKIVILDFDNVGQTDEASRPIAEILVKAPATHLVASGSRNYLEIIVADQKGRLWSYDFAVKESAITDNPDATLLADDIEEKIYCLIATRRSIIIQTESSKGTGYKLYELNRRTRRLQFLGDLNLDKSLSLLHPNNDKLLVGFEKGELRLVEPDRTGTGETAKVHTMDIPRVTAVAMLTGQHVLVAQKGGYITKVDVARASSASFSRQPEAIARACKLLCEILRRCGCLDPCDCREPDDDSGRDRDDNLPGGIRDDEPCEDRHSTKLQWTPKRLAMVGEHVVAFSAGNRRMAVMDQKLNVKFERFLGQGGVAVAAGQAKTQKMILYDSRKRRLETWALADYVPTLQGLLPDDLTFEPEPPSTVTYYGSRVHRATPNPELKVCVFTVIEPGQSFTDPNQNKLIAQIEPNVFDIVNDYYDENSYGDLDVQFSAFGYDFGGTRTPLVLPQPISDYFYDDFTPGGVQAVMPADWTNPLVLDGTESLELRTNPRVGTGEDYPIPFAALWTARDHTSYPVVVDFDGTETLQLTVETQEGDTHVLDLEFDALSLTHNQGDDESAFLDALGTHFTDAIRDAESSLTDSPVTIQDVIFRRIRLNDDDTQFGLLQGQFRVSEVAPADFVQKGTIEITSIATPLPDAFEATGFGTFNRETGVLTSNSVTRDYFETCLRAAQADAGEGPGQDDPHFNTAVDSSEDTAAQELTVTIELTNNKGGAGANIEVINSSGHSESGWSAAIPLSGSESNVNNQNTLRYSRKLADDVFTAAMDHIRTLGPWNPDNTRAMFEEFDVMMIGFVGEPPSSIPLADRWGADDPADFGRLRMFRRTHIAVDLNNPDPDDTPVSMNTSVVIGQEFNGFSPGIMAHELGHAIGLPDLYSASGFRDDVLYIDRWAMMGGGNWRFNHFCGWSKWKLDWIVEDDDDDLNRVIEVPMPAPMDTSVTEAWLVPVEYWDGSMKTDVRAVVGGSVPIGQLMKIHLGSDGGVINFLELHAPGVQYSQNLPPSPSVIATNVLDPESDRRWAVNGLYRRSVHRLNQGNELMSAGDTWDFASGVEFPLKGTTVEVVDVQSIRGGSIPVFHLRVEREQAEFIDLHFQDHVPSWRSPDIWIDWPGDNPDPDVPRVYPEGTPTDQGETVRFPSSGFERHFMVARVHNAGNIRAEDVKVRWFICDPPGSGDDGRWIERDTMTIAEVGPDTSEIAPFDWNIDNATNVHQCLRAEIIDWTIPSEVDPSTGDTIHLASDDVKLQNNNAQQNVFDFEALAASPYDTIEFQMQVHNDYVETEVAALVPDGLPWGSKLEVSPAEVHVKPGTNRIFNCKLSLDDSIIQPGCDNDSGFLLTIWRRAEDSDEKWGSCFYFIRPRYKTELRLGKGYWINRRIELHGQWRLSTQDNIDITGEFPLFVRIRLAIHTEGEDEIIWRTVQMDSNGNFSMNIERDLVANENSLTAQAWFDRTDLLGSSVSEPLVINRSVIE
ncbi:hypothetical protein NC796_13795 [Aliifodinibius sp. S!AR15-10]|uniref:hypothetical protein n=1 Tax=Aliifodinibius sp. S!AR15-10 TaxID=2950437 RepID=UPI002855412A|nr:hypothetical protein [Aliifodinibius sp. S!AR15-10]MDR8392221.1 hypothetical protein [Aliifodinibius sp. S!AR15-10]